MTPAKTVEEAVKRVESYKEAAKDFRLPIADSMLDPSGLNMAIVGDTLLKRGFWPDGFEQKDGFRIYKYKEKPEVRAP